MFDISRAHFYGKARRRVFVELEAEDKAEYGEDKCGLLLKSMYGTQDASQIWQEDYVELLSSAGHARGKAHAAVFYNAEKDARTLVHEDDFMALADQDVVDEFEQLLASKYEYKKTANLGFEAGDDREAVFLNRVITLECGRPRRVIIEPDARHAQLIVKELGLQTARGVETPAEKLSSEQQLVDAKSPPLDPKTASQFRSVCMRAAYSAQDRADLNEATKTLARSMQQPTEASMRRLRRLAKYLIKYPSVAKIFPEQRLQTKMKVYVDTDHAGCAVTRKSTTGMVVRLGQHTLKQSSNLQSTVSLSSGESGHYGLVKGAQTGLGIQALFADWGLDLTLEVLSDSSAARGHVQRRGLGKMRHIQTRYLWVQERVGEGHLKISCVPGTKNPEDILTKSVSGSLLWKHMTTLGYAVVEPSKLQRAVD